MKNILLNFIFFFIPFLCYGQTVISTDSGNFEYFKYSNYVQFNGIAYTVQSLDLAGENIFEFICNNSSGAKKFLVDLQNRTLTEFKKIDPKIDLFEWKDVAFYDKSQLIATLYRNVDIYLNNYDISGNMANAFRNSLEIAIVGIKNNTFVMNGDGSFTDTTGQTGSNGHLDRGFLGRTKNTQNNINGFVANFISTIVKGMTPFQGSDWRKIRIYAINIERSQKMR